MANIELPEIVIGSSSWPSEAGAAVVVARTMYGTADGSDTDTLPDAGEIDGTITITADRDIITYRGDPPTTFVMKKDGIRCKLRGDRFESPAGKPFLVLPPTRGGGIAEQGWTYTAIWRNTAEELLHEVTFEAPAGEIIDLTLVAKTEPSPGEGAGVLATVASAVYCVQVSTRKAAEAAASAEAAAESQAAAQVSAQSAQESATQMAASAKVIETQSVQIGKDTAAAKTAAEQAAADLVVAKTENAEAKTAAEAAEAQATQAAQSANAAAADLNAARELVANSPIEFRWEPSVDREGRKQVKGYWRRVGESQWKPVGTITSGLDGVSVIGAEVTAEGDLKLILSKGDPIEAGNVAGPPPVLEAGEITTTTDGSYGLEVPETGRGKYAVNLRMPPPEGVSAELVRSLVDERMEDIELLAMAGL